MNRAIFIDRDNTIIHNDGDLGDPDAVRLIRGAAHAIGSLRQLGYHIIVVTNQGGVARGHYTESDVDAVHQRIAQLVYESSGVVIDRFYYCPYHPEGTVAEYTREHPWRKPAPGMLLEAADALGLDLKQCWMIGDAERDVEAGIAAGCQTIRITTRSLPDTRAHFQAQSLAESAAIIAQNRVRSRMPILEPAPSIVVGAAAPAKIGAAAPVRTRPLHVEAPDIDEPDEQDDAYEDHIEDTSTDNQSEQHRPPASSTDLFTPTDASDDRIEGADVEPEDPPSRASTSSSVEEDLQRAISHSALTRPPVEQSGSRPSTKPTDEQSSQSPAPMSPSRIESLLVELTSEVRSWRHSQREFTPALMLGSLTLIALTAIAVFIAVYAQGTSATAWIGVTLVAQVGVVGLLLLGLRK